MANMKKRPSGIFMLGSDGVMRSFSGPSTRDVLDAVALSPAQIKQYLDRTSWSQETEDRFRGVDGRKVTSHEALFNPADELKPAKMTEEEVQERRKMVAEYNKKLLEKLEQEKKDDVVGDRGAACGRSVSDYDLSPKNVN